MRTLLINVRRGAHRAGRMSDTLKHFNEIRQELYEMVDAAPMEAVRAARALISAPTFAPEDVRALGGCVLIDAGFKARDANAVTEGTELLRGLLKTTARRPDLEYNLGNGLMAGANLIPYEDVTWYENTGEARKEARRLYASAAGSLENRELCARSLTNLGNALFRGYRFVEAYDYYIYALRSDPTNGVALIGAAKVLLRFVDVGIGDRETLLAVAARLLREARLHDDYLRELAGSRAFGELKELLSRDVSGGHMPNLSSADEYTRFVAQHRLALSPTIEGLDPSIRKWDGLAFGWIIEAPGDDSGIPSVFAILNVLKSDYLAARYLAYLGASSAVPETGTYSDTLDYALYGIVPSLLVLSQRACFDVLDKIAVAATHYLSLPGRTRDIKFANRWFQKDETGKAVWQPQVLDEIRAGNSPLIALSEVARDTLKDGFLHPKRTMRHAGTHSFTVLHDLSATPSRQCRFISHHNVEAFRQHLIDTLQSARAALFYFYETVLAREARLAHQVGPRAHLFVPDHDWVRGRDN